MDPPSETVNHPTYGLCSLEPTLAAIHWASADAIVSKQAVLTDFALLTLETAQDLQADTRRGTAALRSALSEPSISLTWTTADPRQIKDLFIKQKQLGAIEWVAPVYRATPAEKDGSTLFAINPSILFLTEAAYARLDGQAIANGLRMVQPDSMADVKGSVVLQLPNNDATKIANDLFNLPQFADLPQALASKQFHTSSPLLPPSVRKQRASGCVAS
jgi:hypothetical protein